MLCWPNGTRGDVQPFLALALGLQGAGVLSVIAAVPRFPGGTDTVAVLAGVVTALTILPRDFMASLGWNPLTAPTRDWPSGLALGPLGLVMTLTFILCGILLVFFARGLRDAYRSARGGAAGSRLLALGGLAMALLAFPTDPTYRHLPLTWHGLLHDAALAVLGAALSLSLAAFGFSFRTADGGRAMTIFSRITAALIVPAFAVMGLAFYAFLAVFLTWCFAAAISLLRLAEDESRRHGSSRSAGLIPRC
jgi:hypothetical membrane protein